MADIHVIGTVNIGQQGTITNNTPVHFHFPNTDSRNLLISDDVEDAAIVEETKPAQKHFRYFTPKAIQLGITDSLEEAIRAACHESVPVYRNLIEQYTKEGLVDMHFTNKKREFDHINELYDCTFDYEYFRKF